MSAHTHNDRREGITIAFILVMIAVMTTIAESVRIEMQNEPNIDRTEGT